MQRDDDPSGHPCCNCKGHVRRERSCACTPTSRDSRSAHAWCWPRQGATATAAAERTPAESQARKEAAPVQAPPRAWTARTPAWPRPRIPRAVQVGSQECPSTASATRRSSPAPPPARLDQAQLLTAATDRALDDARTLERNAVDMNAQAVAPLRSVIAKLVAAQALTSELTRYAKSGQPGPGYAVTVKEALGDLGAAVAALSSIAHKYSGSAGPGKPAPPARNTGAAQRQR
jgi:hypothetical protein